MARHQCRHALQQIQVETRTEHVNQRAIVLALDFIGGHRTHTFGRHQLQTGAQQAAGGELVTRFTQQ
ncbi:hypothetical protein D3C81_2010660 [compost metagenome]